MELDFPFRKMRKFAIRQPGGSGHRKNGEADETSVYGSMLHGISGCVHFIIQTMMTRKWTLQEAHVMGDEINQKLLTGIVIAAAGSMLIVSIVELFRPSCPISPTHYLPL